MIGPGMVATNSPSPESRPPADQSPGSPPPNPFESPATCDLVALANEADASRSLPLGVYSIVAGSMSGIFTIAPFTLVKWMLRNSTPSEWANYISTITILFAFALATAIAGFILACVGLTTQKHRRVLSALGALLSVLILSTQLLFFLRII